MRHFIKKITAIIADVSHTLLFCACVALISLVIIGSQFAGLAIVASIVQNFVHVVGAPTP